MNTLRGVTQRQLVSGELENNSWKYDLMDIQSVTNIETAIKARKIYSLQSQIGKELTEKMTCAVLVAFCDGIKITKDKPDGFEIIEMATLFLETYTHESISDLILCLKMVKQGKFGKIYNRFDLAVFNEFFKQYLDYKYEELENNHLSLKINGAGGVNTVAHTQMHIEAKKERENANKELQQKVNEHFVLKEVIERKLGG